MRAATSGPTTFVLIHGGGSTARFWDRLVPLLPSSERAGPPLAIDLPGRNGKPADFATLTVTDEAESVVADIRAAAIDGPITLVAHSSGGLVVPEVVATLDGQVEHIVLNAALVPAEGARGLDCMLERHRDGLIAAVEMANADGTTITLPGAPADPEPFRTAYGGDPLDDAALAFVTDPARCVADTVHHYFQPVHWSLAAGVPVTYVVNDRDRPVRPEKQAEMIGHLPEPPSPTIVHLDSGHLPAVTDTAAFAEVLGAATGR